jgi:hypothetical protein
MSGFDHAVIYCGDRLAEVAQLYRRLGFVVTPPGLHSLGSANHLIVMGRAYVELLGFPAGQPISRPEFAGARQGLNALVFATSDAQATRARLLAAGLPVTAVDSFSRPVDLGEGQARDQWPLARFRTVRLTPGFCAAGRLYWCEHLTPELVWRAPWRAHPNGALELVAAGLDLRDPAGARAAWQSLQGPAALTDQDEGFELAAPPLTIAVEKGDEDRMSSLTFTVAELGRFSEHCERAGIRLRARGPLQVIDAGQAAGVELQFRA